MGDKKWKHALLSTGVPLEHSVSNVLSRIPGLHVSRTYHFDRIDSGEAKQHSVDFLATFQSTSHNLTLSFLVEAKYRQPSTTWAYRRKAFGAPGSPKLSQFFVGLDALAHNTTLNEQAINGYGKNFSAGIEPVEFRPKNSDFEVVTYVDDGVRQLTYSVAKKVSDSLISQIRCGDRVFTPLHVIVPIAVTTSALKVFSKFHTIHDVQQANSPDDLFDNHDGSEGKARLFTFQKYDDVNFVEHVLYALKQDTNKLEWSMLNESFSESYRKGVEGYLDYLSAKHPSVFMIVNLEQLASTISRLIAFATSPEALTTKSQFARRDNVATG